MIPRIPFLPSRRIFCAALLAMLFTGSRPALAQTAAAPSLRRHQSPLEFSSRVPFDDRTPKFNDTTALAKPITLTLKNNAGALWCNASDCDDHRVEREWASLKA